MGILDVLGSFFTGEKAKANSNEVSHNPRATGKSGNTKQQAARRQAGVSSSFQGPIPVKTTDQIISEAVNEFTRPRSSDISSYGPAGSQAVGGNSAVQGKTDAQKTVEAINKRKKEREEKEKAQAELAQQRREAGIGDLDEKNDLNSSYYTEGSSDANVANQAKLLKEAREKFGDNVKFSAPAQIGQASEDTFDIDKRQDNRWGEEYDNHNNTRTNDKYYDYIDEQTGSSALSEGIHSGTARQYTMMDDGSLQEYAVPLASILYNNTVAIDDGTMDYNHLTSDYMTGSQYKAYVELTGTGRDIDKIDPNAVYSKTDEAIKYGFQRFSPDDATKNRDVVASIASIPQDLANILRDARQDAGDYTITYDGRSTSGHEFDDNAQSYMNNIKWWRENEPERFMEPGENKTAYVRQWTVTDGDKTSYHYGKVEGLYDEGDGTYTLAFTDGSEVEVSSKFINDHTKGDDIILDDPKMVNVKRAGDLDAAQKFAKTAKVSDDLDNSDIVYNPDYVDSNGTAFDYDEVKEIYSDDSKGAGNDKLSYEFAGIGPITNKPARMSNGIFSGDFVNEAIDLVTGSAPLFSSYTAWPVAASSLTQTMSGLDPTAYDPSAGTYQMVSSSYDDNGNVISNASLNKVDIDKSSNPRSDIYASNILGNLALPFSEKIAGGFGGKSIASSLPAIKKFSEWAAKNPGVKSELAKFGLDTLGEGLEEVPGNWWDEATKHGSDFYKNPVTETDPETGKKYKVYDPSGNEIRESDTSPQDVIANMFKVDGDNGLGDAFVNGAYLSTVLGGPLLPRKLKKAKQQQEKIEALGLQGGHRDYEEGVN